MQMLTPRQTNRLREQEDSACKCVGVAFDVQVCVCDVFVSAIAGVVCLAAV